MKTLRVFFDASVIIAAFLSPTRGSSLVFQYIRQGEIIGITSQTAIEEALEGDKPKRLKRSRQDLEQFIAQSNLVVRERITIEEIDPYKDMVEVKDAHLIAGANLTKCGHLVTLDKKHLLRQDIQQKFLPLKIVPPKQLLEELVK